MLRDFVAEFSESADDGHKHHEIITRMVFTFLRMGLKQASQFCCYCIVLFILLMMMSHFFQGQQYLQICKMNHVSWPYILTEVSSTMYSSVFLGLFVCLFFS